MLLTISLSSSHVKTEEKSIQIGRRAAGATTLKPKEWGKESFVCFNSQRTGKESGKRMWTGSQEVRASGLGLPLSAGTSNKSATISRSWLLIYHIKGLRTIRFSSSFSSLIKALASPL